MLMTRLCPTAKLQLLRHYLALPHADRHLRFGGAMAASAVAKYVRRLDLTHDAVFGVLDGARDLVGVAHVPLLTDRAELGLSVLPSFRRRGIGSALVVRAASYARDAGIAALYMQCLAENDAMLHIARSLGLRLVHSGSSAEAFLELRSNAEEVRT